MKTRCRIVCASACRSCDITPCDDRVAEEDTERRLHIAAAQAVAMTSTALYKFFDGRHMPVHLPNIYVDEIAEARTQQAIAKVKALRFDELDEALHHCGMADAILCRHCHEVHCGVRKAPRTF